MKNRKIAWLVGCAVGSVLLAVVILLAWRSFKPIVPAPLVNYTTLQGEKLSTESLRGSVYLVNFWATTCTTCVAEMPELSATYTKYQAQGFKIIAVAMQHDRPDYVLNFAQDRKLPFTVALDLDGQLAESFNKVIMTPTTFVVDKQGKILKRYLGTPNFNQLHALIEQALAT
jgi:peroxiredoxin